MADSASIGKVSAHPSPAPAHITLPPDPTPPEGAPPKKRAVVVYEGDERWKGGNTAAFESDEEDDDEDAGEKDKKDAEADAAVEAGDLLAGLPDDTENIELLHSRVSSVAALRLPRFAKYLKTLCLRQNSITELDPAEFGPLDLLEELDVYDNQIKHVGEALNGKPNLRVLDVSFNLLKTVPPVIETLPALKTVYFVQNKISHINGLSSLSNTLTSLELGGNRIRTIENLDALVNLEELWLGKNKITKLQNLGTLTKLRILSIQSNRIVKLEGLENLVSLEELYLSHNGVERLEGLENNLKLTTIDLGNNRVPEIENLAHLSSLEELWINDNQIPNLHALTPELGKLESLSTIYLEGNPCQKSEGSAYRRKIILALPQVKQIDATYVRKP